MSSLVKCTYAVCKQTFESDKAMRSHKYNSDDHNYCKRCDYDGKDWDDLLQHKIDAMAPFIVGEKRNDKHKEMMHIVCEFCGMEFKSFAGHERHRTQDHQAEQAIVCQAEGVVWNGESREWVRQKCGALALRPSGLVEHYEKNLCFFVTRRQFHDMRQQKYVLAQIMMDPAIFTNSLNESRAIKALATRSSQSNDSHDDDDDDDVRAGGVMLDDLESDGQSVRSDGSPKSVNGKDMSDTLHGMSLSDSATAVTGPYTKCPTDRSRNIGAHLPPNTDSRPAPNWTAVQASTAYTNQSQTNTNLFHSRFWDPSSTDYHPDLFFNMLIERYSCPFPHCDGTYETLPEMESHLSSTHASREIRCSVCLKFFQNVTALVQHFEASQRGSKCSVARSGTYERMLHDVTGGFLGAKSVADDEVYGVKARYVKQDGHRKLALVKVGDGSAVARGQGRGVMKIKYEGQMPEGIVRTRDLVPRGQ